MILAAIKDNLFSSSYTAINISSKVTILDAIHFLARRLVEMETIVNCFRKGGFQVCSEDQPMEELEDQPLALPEVINSESYLHINDSAPFYTENDGIEDEIVEALRTKTSQQQDDDDLEDEPSVPRVTDVAATHSVQLLQLYFTEQGFNDKLQYALDACADEVKKKASKAMKQSTLDLYMSVVN